MSVNTICAGVNCRAIYFTGQTCKVKEFQSLFASLLKLPIAQVAIAVVKESSEKVILIVNEALYFRCQLDHSLINQNQISAYGISISDIPYDIECKFGMVNDDVFITFASEGSTMF